tara:strand:+ start:804 stop:1361 length:558 start_codon:yes stop_codon:yes gene_type:complete
MKQFKPSTLTFIALVALIFTFNACKDIVDTPPNPNEEELITTVELTFINENNLNDVRVFKFADPDGDGGNTPTITDSIVLAANSSYSLAVRFLDESKSPVEDITTEIVAEAIDHLICYITPGDLMITITDKDANKLNLGLAATVKTQGAESTSLTIRLMHQPNQKNGNCDIGETDVEITFITTIE